MSDIAARGRDVCAVVLGHPGYELRIFQTLDRLKPVAYLLTDGSGGTGRARDASTRRVLAAIGVEFAAPFPPPLPDAVLYESLLSGRHQPLLEWARALADDLRRRRVQSVIADAAEGFNPAHDVCRAIARAARQAAGVPRGFAYLLEGRPDACPPGKEPGAHEVVGSEEELARKHAAIADYPEIQFEWQRAAAQWGRDALAREWLFHDDAPIDAPPDEMPPAYERFGADRVKSGKYRDIILHAAHVQPFLARLRKEFTA
jgi:hypothetical protein